MGDSSYKSKADWIANFKQERQLRVGHLVSLTIGGEKLEPEYNFLDPENPTKTVPLCGMIDFLDWKDRLPGEPIIFEGLVSGGNQGIMNYAIEAAEIGSDVEFVLNFYAYDLKAKKYFKCFHTDGKAIKGQLTQDKRSHAEKEKSDEYTQISSHRYTMSIIGSDEVDQHLDEAYFYQKIKKLKFGGKCGAAAG